MWPAFAARAAALGRAESSIDAFEPLEGFVQDDHYHHMDESGVYHDAPSGVCIHAHIHAHDAPSGVGLG